MYDVHKPCTYILYFACLPVCLFVKETAEPIELNIFEATHMIPGKIMVVKIEKMSRFNIFKISPIQTENFFENY